MTTPATPVIAGPFVGTGASAALPFTFPCWSAADLLVTRDDAALAEGTHYSVALNADQTATPGGAVAITAAANTLGATIYVALDMDLAQPTQLTSLGGYYPKVVERALDRLALLIAQVKGQAAQQVSTAALHAANAENSAAAAEAASGPTYASTAAGLAATSTGQGFAVDNGDGTVSVYLNTAGVAVLQRTLATVAYLASTAAGEGAALIGMEGGGTAQSAIDARVQTADLASTASGKGAEMVGFLQSGTGAVARDTQSKLREEASLWDIIPDALRANIEAGSSATDVLSYINQALTNYRRVIVRRGTYRISGPILFTASEQSLEFEDGAWFHPTTAAKNAIAVPHGLLDCRVINPGLIGIETTAAGLGATGILWNSNAGGTAVYGSTSSDDMGGLIENARFKASVAGTTGWNNFIHANMAGGLVIHGVDGRGLIGTATGYGYGVVFSGSDVTLRDIDIDAVNASHGRHGIYLGDQCEGADVSGFRLRNFRKSGLSANTGTTGSNANIRISNGLIENASLDADSSATNGAIDMSYQGAATSGGSMVSISNLQIVGSGTNGIYASGYAKLSINDVTALDWGATAGGSYSALRLLKCDDAQVKGLRSYTAAINNGAYTIHHNFIQESSNVKSEGGCAVNTGSGAQGSAVQLNATGIGTPNALIDRLQVDVGSGSWSVSPYVNPTQNGSTVVFAKQGSSKTDTQTGANIVLDASAGESNVIMDAGATSLLQILPAGLGQTVTVHFLGAVNVLGTNFYGSAPYTAASQRTLTLYCFSAAGASSLWREVAKG